MRPSRELDALIAEKVMGFPFITTWLDGTTCFPHYRGNGTNYPKEGLPYYSTDIAAAWEVVEKLGKEGKQIRLSNKAMANEYWWAYIDNGIAQGETLPHAVCLAALNAVGIDIK